MKDFILFLAFSLYTFNGFSQGLRYIYEFDGASSTCNRYASICWETSSEVSSAIQALSINAPGSIIADNYGSSITYNNAVYDGDKCLRALIESTIVGSFFECPTNLEGVHEGSFFIKNNADACIYEGNCNFGECDGRNLPIDLIYFKANFLESEQLVDIHFKTASQYNVAYLEIERSFDGRHFYPIHRFNDIKESSSIENYYFQDDRTTVHPNLYYQLKTTNLDRSVEYSKIISVNIQASKKHVQLYPNPVQYHINILTSSTGIVQIFNLQGQQVFNTMIIEGQEQINLNHLAEGVYMFYFFPENTANFNQKIIVKRD